MKPNSSLKTLFEEHVSARRPKPKKRLAPLSVRLNENELAAIRKAANGRSINGYVRECLFGNSNVISEPSPVANDCQALARILGALGRTDIYTNLAAISLALEQRRMLASEETEASVREACDLIVEMRSDLLVALGLRKERM